MRAAHRHREQLAAERGVQHVDEPGPPSDIGARSSSSSGASRAQPSAMASAASTAVSVPANLSGATRTRMWPSSPTTYRDRVQWVIRPMPVEDVPAAERLSDEGFYELDTRLRRAADPTPQRRSEAHRAGWMERTRHFLGTDPGGCWVAEDDTGMLGIATSFRREPLWCLATYAVLPGRQGQGIGQPLLAAALHHGRGCLRGMLSASSDPQGRAALPPAGFDLHPQMFLTGTVDRSAIPVVEKVREGSAGDIELMDSLDRRTRGAAHGPDHELMLPTWRLLVSDTSTGRATPTSRAPTPASWPRATGGPPSGCCGRRWPTTRGAAVPHVTAPTMGPRRRAGGPPRAAPGGLSRSARDETARAVRS